MALIIPSRPRMLRQDAEKIRDFFFNKNKIKAEDHPVCCIKVRGYFLNSMGAKGKNDRGIFDDASFWLSLRKFEAFNGNCDASKYRKGYGFGAEKGMASLNEGLWWYHKGWHYGSVPHEAFRQLEKVTVTRDGIKSNYQETGMFGINDHNGGLTSTSSLGCMTTPRSQWREYRDCGYGELKYYGCEKRYPMILVEEATKNKILSGELV